MAISDKLVYLNDTKTAIKNAIETKGVTVGEATFREYATKVSEISAGGTVEEKDVNFYDYDGTLLHSYTIAEAQALIALPPLPDRTNQGLTAQEWNYTLLQIQNVVKATVGVTYATTDGKTHAYLSLNNITGLNPSIYFNKSDTSTLTLELRKQSDNSLIWTTTNNLSGNRNATISGVTESGDYILYMWISSGSGTYGFSNGTFSTRFIGGSLDLVAGALIKLYIGENVTMGTYSIYSFKTLKEITIPNTVMSLDSYSITTLYSIECIIIPNNCDFINASIQNVRNFSKLKVISLPNTVTVLPSQFLTSSNISVLNIPSSVSSIQNDVLGANFVISTIDFSNHSTIPTLSSASASTFNSQTKIYVPLVLESTWKTSTNWVAYTDYIVGV